MAKSSSCTNSLASPTASTSSASSPCSSYASSVSPGSVASSAGSAKSLRSGTSDKSLGLKSSSSIDRRKRLAANARERKRMHLLNKAYDQLRQRLVDAENKSKYDVLVQAKEYIQALATICEKFDQENPRPHHPNQQQIATNSPPTQSHSAPVAMATASGHRLYLDVACKIQNSPMDMSYNSAPSTTDQSPYVVTNTLSQTS